MHSRTVEDEYHLVTVSVRSRSASNRDCIFRAVVRPITLPGTGAMAFHVDWREHISGGSQARLQALSSELVRELRVGLPRSFLTWPTRNPNVWVLPRYLRKALLLAPT